MKTLKKFELMKLSSFEEEKVLGGTSNGIPCNLKLKKDKKSKKTGWSFLKNLKWEP